MISPGTQLGSYGILHPIGKGGMGIVYQAEHQVLGRRVALKVLRPELVRDPEAMTRFINEARAVNRIGHEHIVEVTDFGTSEHGACFYVMELLAGETLQQRLARDGSLPLERALHVCLQVTDALAACHAAGIVHRDLKPENIFLTTRQGSPDYVKLLDFGLCKLNHQGPSTLAGVKMGTPSYMSPEQCEGRTDIDHRTDLYSLGVVLYQVVVGELPFPNPDWATVMHEHMTARFPRARTRRPELPEPFDTLLQQATAKSPAARFTSVVEMRERLLGLLDYSGRADPAAAEAGADLGGEVPGEPTQVSHRQKVTGRAGLSPEPPTPSMGPLHAAETLPRMPSAGPPSSSALGGPTVPMAAVGAATEPMKAVEALSTLRAPIDWSKVDVDTLPTPTMVAQAVDAEPATQPPGLPIAPTLAVAGPQGRIPWRLLAVIAGLILVALVLLLGRGRAPTSSPLVEPAGPAARR